MALKYFELREIISQIVFDRRGRDDRSASICRILEKAVIISRYLKRCPILSVMFKTTNPRAWRHPARVDDAEVLASRLQLDVPNWNFTVINSFFGQGNMKSPGNRARLRIRPLCTQIKWWKLDKALPSPYPASLSAREPGRDRTFQCRFDMESEMAYLLAFIFLPVFVRCSFKVTICDI